MVGVREILHCLGPASGSGTGPLARAFSASLFPPFPAAADLCFVLVWNIQPQRASCPFLRARAVLLISFPETEHLCSWPSAIRTSHLTPRGRKVLFLLILLLWQQEQSRSSPIISLRAFALNWKKAPGKSTVSFPDPRSTQLTPVPSVKLLYSLLPVEESLGMRAHSPCVQGSWLTGPYSACGNVSILADLLLHACMTAMFSSCSATAETVYVISLLKGTSPSWNSVHGRFAMQFSDRLRKSMVV